ncbi:peptidylprolyl isomerase [Candidatus Woesearchaeota archaeon]|nr:peptidylprolyl isomerase [Candidatus Woesearchaeota archaeon]MBI2130359.1 peptidylprolyl isomerase [Candidatus Woesearchaeota archaeon]MBI2661094.1 peptidylprolyl isomerase [Candidatus Woesearchaeota archaeon]
MAAIRNHDFVEVQYTGKLKDDNSVFDTTDAEIAKKHDIYDENGQYGSMVVCIGKNHLLKGLDARLIGKEIGREYDFELQPEEAFGRKDAKLIQLIPTNKFRESKVQPFPGLQVNIDGIIGTIRTVSGGRTMVDFNHPLAGREVSYSIKVLKAVEDDKDKLMAMLRLAFGKSHEFNVSIDNGIASVGLKHEMPEELQKQINEEIKEAIPSITKVVFTTQEEKKVQENK